MLSVEDIGHNDEVDSLDPRRPCKLDLMQSHESSDHRVWIGQHVVIVILHDCFEVLELIVTDRLEHVEPISCVIEEGAGLAGRTL